MKHFIDEKHYIMDRTNLATSVKRLEHFLQRSMHSIFTLHFSLKYPSLSQVVIYKIPSK